MSSRSECKHKSGRGGKHGSGAAASRKAYAPIGWLTKHIVISGWHKDHDGRVTQAKVRFPDCNFINALIAKIDARK